MSDFSDIVRGMRQRIEAQEMKCRAMGCPTKLKDESPFCEFHLRLLENRKHPFMYTAGAEQATYLDDAIEHIAKVESRGRDQ